MKEWIGIVDDANVYKAYFDDGYLFGIVIEYAGFQNRITIEMLKNIKMPLIDFIKEEIQCTKRDNREAFKLNKVNFGKECKNLERIWK